jgi:hypothetical protein
MAHVNTFDWITTDAIASCTPVDHLPAPIMPPYGRRPRRAGRSAGRPKTEVNPMSVRLTVAALAILCAPPVARSADEENPFKNAKVGDYATYKMSVKFAGTTLGGTSTQSVTAKSDKEATVKTTGEFEFMGNKQEIPPQEQKIDLTKPFDPTKVGGGGGLPPGTDVKVEKGKEGKEKIKVGGKEYDCTWTIYKVTGKAGEMALTADVKAWMSKELPLAMVKMEMTADVAKMKMEMTMELTESGNKK